MEFKTVVTGIVFSAFVSLAGCSDENKEIRGQFLAGCVQSGVSKSICSCSFERLEEKYTPEEMKKINSHIGAPPQQFMQDVMESAVACRNE